MAWTWQEAVGMERGVTFESFFNAFSEKDMVIRCEGRPPGSLAAALMGLLDTELGDTRRIGLWARVLMRDLGTRALRQERLRCLDVSGMDPRERRYRKETFNVE